jgi:hypothetical protein
MPISFSALPVPVLLFPALLVAVPADAQSRPSGKEVSVPFITRGTVRTFEPDADGRGVYIQNSRRDWYYARFFTRCNELPYTVTVGFQTFGGGSTLSRGDTIIAGRERCRIASIVKRGPPPKKAKKPRRG